MTSSSQHFGMSWGHDIAGVLRKVVSTTSITTESVLDMLSNPKTSSEPMVINIHKVLSWNASSSVDPNSSEGGGYIAQCSTDMETTFAVDGDVKQDSCRGDGEDDLANTAEKGGNKDVH